MALRRSLFQFTSRQCTKFNRVAPRSLLASLRKFSSVSNSDETLDRTQLIFEEARSTLSTVRDVIRFGSSRFTKSSAFFGHGTHDPYEEALFLVGYSLRIPARLMDSLADARLTPTELEEVLDLLLTRLEKRIPAAYLTNQAILGDYSFYVDKRVIIPRSFIAELLKNRLEPWISEPNEVTSVLDLCTGSGALAVMAAHCFPDAEIHASDISKDALDVAQINVADYNLQNRITLIESDLFSSLPQPSQYDVILCNPPYVKSADMNTLPEEYTHEPRISLEAGPDGLQFIRTILQQASRHLKENGILVVELGDRRPELEAAYPGAPFIWLTTSQGDDMVFMIRKEDLATLQHPSSPQTKKSGRSKKSERIARIRAKVDELTQNEKQE